MRFDDHRITGHEGGRHLSRRQRQRIVPRHQRDDDAVGHTQNQNLFSRRVRVQRVAFDAPRPLRVVFELPGSPHDFSARLSERLALLRHDGVGK